MSIKTDMRFMRQTETRTEEERTEALLDYVGQWRAVVRTAYTTRVVAEGQTFVVELQTERTTLRESYATLDEAFSCWSKLVY